MKKIIFASLIFSLPLLAQAAAPEWQIVPDKSHLNFTAIQNNAPITGSFKTFSGVIHFDPKQLNASDVKIVVDMNSVTTSYDEVMSTLLSSDWFDTKKFPQAVFTANKFTQIDKDNFQADGNLTIRNKSVPTTLKFKFAELSDKQAHAIGNATLKRLTFNVGQGEWSKTDQVKDDVQVQFDLVAMRK